MLKALQRRAFSRKMMQNTLFCVTLLQKRRQKLLMNQLRTLSDEQLMSRTAAGDEAAFEQLYDRYAAKVMGFIYKIVQDQGAAAEILQELFIRLWDRRKQYNSSKARFTTWMFGIARNMAIDRLRRMKRRPAPVESEAEMEQMERAADAGQNVAQEVSNRLRYQQLTTAVQALPEDQRRVIEQAYFGGLTRQEIATTMNIPLGTVHSRARLALKKLGQLLEELQGEHE